MDLLQSDKKQSDSYLFIINKSTQNWSQGSNLMRQS